MVDEFVFEFLGSPPDRDRDARDLEDWLNLSEDLRGAAEVRMAPAQPGEQGALADAAVLMASFGVMVKPFFSWLTERAKARQISVRVSGRNKKVELTITGPADVMPAVERLTEALGDK